MRLSEYEQRQLAELELALARADPRYVRRFAADLTAHRPRRWHRLRRRLHRLLGFWWP